MPYEGFDRKKEEFSIQYSAVSDVVSLLTKDVNPTVYWRKLKENYQKKVEMKS